MKKLCALLLTAAMVLSMTACGGKPQESSQNQKDQGQAEAVQTEGSSTGQETEPAQEAQGESGQKEDIVLSYWAQWSENETQAQVLKAAIARFEENNPGCKVEVNWAGRDVRDILRSSIDSGNKIDIVEGDFSKITGNLGEDYLMDLTRIWKGQSLKAPSPKEWLPLRRAIPLMENPGIISLPSRSWEPCSTIRQFLPRPVLIKCLPHGMSSLTVARRLRMQVMIRLRWMMHISRACTAIILP